MEKVHLYVDRLSQPSRAILIFCMVNKVDFEEHLINLAKRDHKQPEFKAINALGYVPAIDVGGFKLFESHAILRYLCYAYPCVQDHWYPSDLAQRARIDSILDWHHSNLRRGSAGLVLNRVLGPALGLPLNPQAASEAENLLKLSLSKLETFWLPGNDRFLTGSYEPSIADLSLACEVMQLELLDRNDIDMLLGPREKVRKWIEKVKKATEPYFEEAHDKLYKASMRLHGNKLQVNSNGTALALDSSRKALSSKL
ncbi:hypothetical protein SUGI_0401430 [Cryptomeria japonica]|uniref:glutathione S-transferase T1 n=1 Tax=Cryptomeria japonica TaxID=3369 RepID=UPI0024089706|nr:glutathione S-transferase T1 [Cryptomeria japonica]GLJ21604.1 hypothetical protein SUGI_0401430 [Cryptomeria japonica]